MKGQPLSSVKKQKTEAMIIHLDNDVKNILEPSKNLFDQLDTGLEYVICESRDDFKEKVDQNSHLIKALIFDLLSSEPGDQEINEQDAEFLQDMRDGFARFNIPIFVYSGYLQALGNEFDGLGTVFKVEKGDGDFKKDIVDKIIFLYNSGFIDVFSPGGVLEMDIKDELHKAFTKQFSESSHIEQIIESINNSVLEGEDKVDRVKKVFKRIAIKTLSSDLLAPIADGEDKVHPIEHFYRRQSSIDVWTGDIWKNKAGGNHVLVLTPRCDFAVGKAENLIFININELPKPINLKGNPEETSKRMRNYLTDNLPGKSSRYIPSNVFFPTGGMAIMNEHTTISKDTFINDFEYVITLSDDLTNEIIGKFAYYFLRTGITNINEAEFEAIIKAINSQTENG